MKRICDFIVPYLLKLLVTDKILETIVLTFGAFGSETLKASRK